MTLDKAPTEVLLQILEFVDPRDLAAVSATSRLLRGVITSNDLLFKAIYLSHFDKPPQEDFDYVQALKDVVKLTRICKSLSDGIADSHMDFVLDTALHILASASNNGRIPDKKIIAKSYNTDFLASIFAPTYPSFPPQVVADGIDNAGRFVCRSSLFGQLWAQRKLSATPKRSKKDIEQLSAKLHCMYGQMLRHYKNFVPSSAWRLYPNAAARVYDIRTYTMRNRWGPFLNDSSMKVDWEKMEAIMIVIGENLSRQSIEDLPACVFWKTPFAGSYPNSYIGTVSNDAHVKEGLEARDPYGITGTWVRIVCFLDYSEFFLFNWPGRAPNTYLNTEEATRLILMSLKATKIEPPGPEDGQDLPVVHFKGISRWIDGRYDPGTNPAIRGMKSKGTVRLTKEGEVRWTSVSIFNGEERWRSESIQIGGVRSARGVYGTWFDGDYDPHGPVGPTAFWKIRDRVLDKDSANSRLNPEVDALISEFEPSDGAAHYYNTNDDEEEEEDDDWEEEVDELDHDEWDEFDDSDAHQHNLQDGLSTNNSSNPTSTEAGVPYMSFKDTNN